MHTARSLACSAGALAVLVAVSACSSSGSSDATTSPATPASSPSTSTTPSSSASATPSTSAPPLQKKLHGTCGSLLPKPQIEDTIDVHFGGKTAFVVGTPEKNIGRLAYLNCRYGLGTGKKAVPKIEIGISLYKSAAQASKRLEGTIVDYRNHGASHSAVTVAGLDATILAAKAPGYNVPTLVLASGQRTVAVSMTRDTAPASRRASVMTKLAALALDRTAP